MKNITLFLIVLVTFLFSVAETSAQITPPYYNPANVNITGGNINGTVIGGTTPATGAFSTLTASTLFTVGSGSTTNAGIIAGYCGLSGNSCLWNTAFTPSASNYNVVMSSTATTLNGGTSANLNVANNNKLSVTASLTTSINPLSVTDTTDSSSTTTGSLKTAGGLGVVKKAFFGDSLNVAAPGTLSVGTGSGTSAGLVAGYLGTSGYGAIWGTGSSFATTDYSLSSNTALTSINGANGVYIRVSTAAIVTVDANSTTITNNIVLGKTITAPATTGAQTINKTTGRVNFAAAATSLVVTNSLATANSICHATAATNDATGYVKNCVAAAGNITINVVAPTAEMAVNFTVTN